MAPCTPEMEEELPPGSEWIAIMCSTFKQVAMVYGEAFNVALKIEADAFQSHFPATPL